MGVNRYLGGVISADPNTPTVTSASGTWTLAEAYQNIGNWPMAQSQIQNSLRFNSADSAYLSRTPSVAGNRKTWTLSFWHKRTKISDSAIQTIWGTTSNTDLIGFDTDDVLRVWFGTNTYNIETTQVFRDVGAWGHWIVSVDTTQATSSNRVKIYYNGSQITAFSTASYPTQNYETGTNNTVETRIGRMPSGDYNYLNGYLTEINFIDGLALSADYFGFFDANGIWQPKPYKGAYGTNGFYLPMTLSATATGFSTVTYEGNASTNKITGTGFAPDLVWIKDRSYPSGSDHFLFDALRTTYSLSSNTTGAETQKNNDGFTSLDPDGFTLNGSGGGDNINRTDSNMVAWCWDAGSSTVTNNDGTITGAQVRANPTYGFSVVTWTNASNGDATVGHGLGAAPKLIITKKRSTTNDWYTFTTAIDSSYDYLKLNATDAKVDSAKAAPTSTVFTTDMGDTSTAVAYCFSEISGFSKIGSYSGTGSAGNTVTLGFKPAFVMVKQTNASGQSWYMADSTRDPVNPIGLLLEANSSSAEFDSGGSISFTNTGFVLNETGSGFNASGSTYIYIAFADTRAFDPFDDYSGNGNNWQPNNIGTDDVFTDVPTNQGTDTGAGGEVRGNYATINPLALGAGASATLLNNGNLNFGTTADGASNAGNNVGFRSTMGVTSGKWYIEGTKINATNNHQGFGFGTPGIALGTWNGGSTNSLTTSTDQFIGISAEVSAFIKTGSSSATTVASGFSYAQGNVYGIALDLDNDQVSFYLNGSQLGSTTSFTRPTGAIYFVTHSQATTWNYPGWAMNFGQKPFSYAAPSGFKALCTQNLPTPTILDGGEYFNATLWTGNGSTQTITTGIANDLVWTKDRGAAYDHTLFDVIRTPGYFLRSNATSAEEYRSDSLTAFTSTGFSVGADSVRQNINKSGNAYVSWAWKAGGTGVANGDGTIPSTVSANTTAGFSIATYTSTGSAATVGHGLGVAPAWVIIKCRNNATNWMVWTDKLTTNYALEGLNTTGAETSGGSPSKYIRAVDSTTFTIGGDISVNQGSGYTYVAYCFAPVAGYSAFGSYTGNGSADGPFVFCGFRPRYVLVKNVSTTGDWFVYDTSRNTYNVADNRLKPNLSDAEGTGGSYGPDILSNGFKMRSNFGELNGSGNTIIYAAFAENPFKLSRAR